MKIDRELAQQHLGYLGYKPGENTYFRFFYHSLDPRKNSDKGRKNSQLNWSAIEKYQDEGRGVYVVVNGADGGHSDGDIKQCCAIFCEWDDLPLSEQSLKWQELGFVEPTFTVYSGDKSMQPYWVFEEPIAVEEWRSLQKLLISVMDADKSNKNPSRVFRLAGGWHVKPGREPIKTEILQDSGIRYSYKEISEKLTALAILKAEAEVTSASASASELEAELEDEAGTKKPKWKEIKLPVPMPVPIEVGLSQKSRESLGGVSELRNTSMATLARDLIGTAAEFDRLGQAKYGDPFDLFFNACQKCSGGGGWGDREWEQIWRSATAKPQVSSIAHHLPDAVENCIKAWYWRTIINWNYPDKSTDNADNLRSGSPQVSPKVFESDDKLIQDYNKVVKTFGKRIKLNKLSKRIEVDGKPVSLDRAKLQLAIRHNVLLKSGREDIQDIIAEVAEQNEYSPVAEYLRSLPFCMDTSILDRISETYFGVSGDIYTTFIRKTLIAAVNRALVPGCKVDTALILHGKQGYKKSTFFRILAGEYFDDSMGAASDKDERLKLHRSWLVEWSELERIFGKKDASAAKAFVTSQIDTIRPPYGRDIQDLARPSIIVATTNQDEFLVDPTGARRFWVIPVQKKIDTDQLKEERDAIWGAAMAAFQAGELCYLNDEEELVAEAIASEFRTSDPWEESIGTFIENREWVRVSDILDHLQIDLDRQDRSHQMRVASILKVMGWSKNIRSIGKKRVRVWAPDLPQNNLDLPKSNFDQPEKTEVVLPKTPSLSPLQPFLLPCDLPELPKSEHLEKSKDVAKIAEVAEVAKSPDSLGVKVDQVDPVVQNQVGQGVQDTLLTENGVVSDKTEVDHIESELVDFIRSAIASEDRATAKHIQDVLRDVCDASKADRSRVWNALSTPEQESFKNLLMSLIEEIDAQKIRDIALVWWDEQYPDGLQSLVTKMFGRGQPGEKYSIEIIKAWLLGESQVVRDRITELLNLKNT